MMSVAERRTIGAHRVGLACGYSRAARGSAPFVVTVSLRGSRVSSAACTGSRIARWIWRTFRTPRISIAYFSTAASKSRPCGISTTSLHAMRRAFVERSASKVIILLSRCIVRLFQSFERVTVGDCGQVRGEKGVIGFRSAIGAELNHSLGTNDPMTNTDNYLKRECVPHESGVINW